MAFGKWRKGTAIAAACGIVCLLAAVALLFATRESRAEGLTLEEARGVVLEQYGGKIVSSSARDGGYLLELKTDKGLYEVTVGGKSADLTGIRLLERYEDNGAGGEPAPTEIPLPTAEDGTGPSPSPTASPAVTQTPPPNEPIASGKPSTGTPGSGNKPAPSVHISEERAVSLALAKVPGKVTDVDKEEDDGVWHYYVDIETEDGREAEVQLIAASGAIVTVAWDDDDDDD